MNANQLFEDIEAIRASIARLEHRKEAASLEEVKALGNRPLEVNAREVAQLLLPELQKRLPTTDQFNEAAQRVEQAVGRVPRTVSVTGDVYGFTSWKAALIYGMVLLLTVAVAWYTCSYYREQATATVIFEQAKEVAKERDYYYHQIQTYKKQYPKYANLFPSYDDKGFWKKFK